MTPAQLADKFYTDMRHAAYEWWMDHEAEGGFWNADMERAFAFNGTAFEFIMTHPWRIEDELIQESLEKGEGE